MDTTLKQTLQDIKDNSQKELKRPRKTYEKGSERLPESFKRMKSPSSKSTNSFPNLVSDSLFSVTKLKSKTCQNGKYTKKSNFPKPIPTASKESKVKTQLIKPSMNTPVVAFDAADRTEQNPHHCSTQSRAKEKLQSNESTKDSKVLTRNAIKAKGFKLKSGNQVKNHQKTGNVTQVAQDKSTLYSPSNSVFSTLSIPSNDTNYLSGHHTIRKPSTLCQAAKNQRQGKV